MKERWNSWLRMRQIALARADLKEKLIVANQKILELTAERDYHIREKRPIYVQDSNEDHYLFDF